jgi:RNA polymerase sigma-70 factor (ECF subfamily)
MKSKTREPVSTTRGDPFQTALVALIPHLRAFSRILCRNPVLAEDMAQDALAKAWRSRCQFQEGTNLKAWLFTILRHQFYSHQRRAWRDAQWDETKGDRIAAAPNSQQWAMELSDTANALHELPDIQREALILIAAGGFSYEEAAKICDAPVGTMKSRLARGRAALMQSLDSDEKHARTSSVRRDGGTNDILAQLKALTPAEAPRAALA